MCSSDLISPLAPEYVIQMRLFLHDGARWGWYYPVEKVDSPALDWMGTRYIVAGVKMAGRMSGMPRFRHVASLPGNELFENTTAMPRFRLVHEVRRAASVAGVDLRKVAVTGDDIALPPGGGAHDAVLLLEYQPDSLELAVSAAGPAVLVAAETEYPGWRAWVDGRPAEIHRVDLAFRGVAVPAGAHRVRMEFRPVILWVGLGVTVAAAALLAALAISGLRRRGEEARLRAGA